MPEDAAAGSAGTDQNPHQSPVSRLSAADGSNDGRGLHRCETLSNMPMPIIVISIDEPP